MIDLNELNLNKKSKEYILSKISNNDIIRHFYTKQITSGEAIPSPLREDKTPSFAFYMNNGNLSFYDFGTGKRGGAFDFVMELFNVSFSDSLDIILSEFRLQEPSKRVYNKIDTMLYKPIKTRKKALIQFKARRWEKDDVIYWNTFGIKLSTLKKFKVIPISNIFYNKTVFKAEKYAYAYVERIDDIIYTKIYQPHSKTTKWLSNMPSKVLFGYTNIPENGELLIITKALKEIMSLYDTLNIPSIGVQQENIIIKEEVLRNLQLRFKNIITMFDNDKQGLRLYNKYKEIGVNGFLFNEDKNYSDLIENIGINKSKSIIIKKIKKL